MLFCDIGKSYTALRPCAPYGSDRLTESILALNDTAVLITEGNNVVLQCSQSIRTILGIHAGEVIKNGWQLLFDRIHPCDQKLLNKKIHPVLRRFLRKTIPAEREHFIFNYTFRIRHRNDHYIFASLENQMLRTQSRSSPSLYMSILKNINPFADRSKIVLNVRKKENNAALKDVLQQEYFVQANGFSPRETQILHGIAHGLSSREIGEKLFISAETVRCHRKKLMSKAGCKTSAELVSVAVRENIL